MQGERGSKPHRAGGAQWEDDDVEGETASPPSLHWDEEEGITARRSAPRVALHSSPWDSVHPDELISSIPPPAPAVGAIAKAPSVSPVSVEIDSLEGESTPSSVDFRKGTFPVRGAIIASAVAAAAAMALVLNASALRRSPPRHVPLPPVAAAEPPPAPPPIAPAAPEPEATISTSAPLTATPAKDTGTVVGSRDHRLFIDGHAATGWRAEVKCGKHLVRNGSHGAERPVDVPCGGEIPVAP